jgi:hypothetical protein
MDLLARQGNVDYTLFLSDRVTQPLTVRDLMSLDVRRGRLDTKRCWGVCGWQETVACRFSWRSFIPDLLRRQEGEGSCLSP